MVFFGGKWRTNNYNQNYYSSTDPPRETKGERTHNITGEQCPLLGDNSTQNGEKERRGLSPVYETTSKTSRKLASSDEDSLPPPPPPQTNNQGHYRHGGLVRVTPSSSPNMDCSEPSESDESSSYALHRHHHHYQSYIHSVLFGGLWARNNSLYEDHDNHHSQEEGDEEEDRPSLTSNFEVDSDLAVLRLCGLYAILYVLMAVVAFSFVFEQWTIIDSMYFAVATFTTVGVRTEQVCIVRIKPSLALTHVFLPLVFVFLYSSTETNNRPLSLVSCLPLLSLFMASLYWAFSLVYLDMPLVWDSSEHCKD